MAERTPQQPSKLAEAFEEAMSRPPSPPSQAAAARPPGFDYQPPPPPPPVLEPPQAPGLPPPPPLDPSYTPYARDASARTVDSLRRSASVYGTVGVTVLVLAIGVFVFAIIAQVMKSNATGVLAGLVIAVGLLIAGILLLGFSTLFAAMAELSRRN